MKNDALLTVNQLSFRYENLSVLEDISFSLQQGESIAIMGRSGCGKSTLLKLIAGLISTPASSIHFDGCLSFLFQQDSLLPWYSLHRNIYLALSSCPIPKKEKHRRVTQILNQFGLLQFADYLPSQLSGGMKQRGALARALITEPSLLLMDEPFAAVDMLTRRELTESFFNTDANHTRGQILVTHDPDEALFLADRIIVLGQQPAKIIADIPNPGRPANWHDFYHSESIAQLREMLLAMLIESR